MKNKLVYIIIFLVIFLMAIKLQHINLSIVSFSLHGVQEEPIPIPPCKEGVEMLFCGNYAGNLYVCNDIYVADTGFPFKVNNYGECGNDGKIIWWVVVINAFLITLTFIFWAWLMKIFMKKSFK